MLTSKQRVYLRGLGQQLDTIFQIGKSGITDEICLQISNALEARELIKVRVLDNSGYSAREAADEIAEAIGPYISSVRIRYAFPLGYRVYVEEEAPVYYTRIADDYFAISRELKVLERATSPRRFKAQGLQQITLGGVKSVMLGQTLRYDGEYLDRVLQDIDPLATRCHGCTPQVVPRETL